MKRIDAIEGARQLGKFYLTCRWVETYKGEEINGVDYWDDDPCEIEIKSVSLYDDLTPVPVEGGGLVIAMIQAKELDEQIRLTGDTSYERLKRGMG